MKPTKTATATFGLLMILGSLPSASVRAQEPARREPLIKHDYDFETAFLKWQVAPADKAYLAIDGARMKGLVKDVVGISLKSKATGNQYWGRIAGTEADKEAEQWVADKFRALGLQDVHNQDFDLPPQWFPTSWSVVANGGGQSVKLESAQPGARSAATPAGGLDLDAVWVGLGTAADFQGRDVRGRVVVIHSNPTPSVIQHSAVWNGALARAADQGAAAVIVALGIPGNFKTQLNATAKVPTFSISMDDANKLRDMIEKGAARMKLTLNTEMRSGLKCANVWGVLPGATDEEIVVMAHHDAYFTGALDNASGMSTMLTLAEYFSKIPKAQRRRTIRFVTTSGHHAGSLGTLWMHDNAATFLKKTALLLNCEHVSIVQTYLWGPNMRLSNNVDARRWWVNGSRKLASAVLDAYKSFGVTVYYGMEPNASGDMGHVAMDAPSVQIIESPAFYHSDQDTPEKVPNTGLEAMARSFAKVIDSVNKMTIAELQATAEPAK